MEESVSDMPRTIFLQKGSCGPAYPKPKTKHVESLSRVSGKRGACSDHFLAPASPIVAVDSAMPRALNADGNDAPETNVAQLAMVDTLAD